jgi:hypothetical protein
MNALRKNAGPNPKDNPASKTYRAVKKQLDLCVAVLILVLIKLWHG